MLQLINQVPNLNQTGLGLMPHQWNLYCSQYLWWVTEWSLQQFSIDQVRDQHPQMTSYCIFLPFRIKILSKALSWNCQKRKTVRTRCVLWREYRQPSLLMKLRVTLLWYKLYCFLNVNCLVIGSFFLQHNVSFFSQRCISKKWEE